MVNVFAFYFVDPNSNPADEFCKLFEKNGNKQKDARVGLFLKHNIIATYTIHFTNTLKGSNKKQWGRILEPPRISHKLQKSFQLK